MKRWLHLRRSVAERQRLCNGLWVIGLAAAAAAVGLGLDGVWWALAALLPLAATLSWLAGAWVMPWSDDRYVLRLIRLWNHWVVDTRAAYGLAPGTRWVASDQATARLVRKLGRIKPPGALVVEHRELEAALRAHLEALRAIHTAADANDQDRLSAAMHAWERSGTKLRATFGDISDRSGFCERWPWRAPADPASGPAAQS